MPLSASIEELRFERGSQLRLIGQRAFMETVLETIVLPLSAKELRTECFSNWLCLILVLFERGSQLGRIGPRMFFRTSIDVVMIPASVKELYEEWFYRCRSLESVTFECESRLKRVERLPSRLLHLDSFSPDDQA
jgi:hypothetical protein